MLCGASCPVFESRSLRFTLDIFFFWPPCWVSTQWLSSSKWPARGGRRSRCVHFCAYTHSACPKQWAKARSNEITLRGHAWDRAGNDGSAWPGNGLSCPESSIVWMILLHGHWPVALCATGFEFVTSKRDFVGASFHRKSQISSNPVRDYLTR